MLKFPCRLKFFLASALAITLAITWAITWAAPGAWAAALKDDANCKIPVVTATASFAGERTTYDLESMAGFAPRIRGHYVLAWYTAHDWEYRFNGKMEKGCLQSLDFTIGVRPVIALREKLKNSKKQKCAIELLVQRERLHDTSVRAEFSELSANIKDIMAAHFKGKAVADEPALKATIEETLDEAFVTAFNEKLWDRYEAFHQQWEQTKPRQKKCNSVGSPY
ncbi:MAG: hypothetical protein O3A85_06995 [Proteobacteria bacterium]|nr:hypothetical protein [Pseudomonadota bacterium]